MAPVMQLSPAEPRQQGDRVERGRPEAFGLLAIPKPPPRVTAAVTPGRDPGMAPHRLVWERDARLKGDIARIPACCRCPPGWQPLPGFYWG